jgi:aconitate decarboxylase
VHDALESPQGYFAMYGNKPEPERAVADLGRLYYAKGMHKLHPSCYGNHNPIEAALEIVQQHHFAAAEIESVVLDVPPNRVHHFLNQAMDAADGQARALFSIPFAIANVLMRREVQIAHYTAPLMHDPQLLALTRKVRLEPNLPLGRNQASRLTVKLKDGRSFTTARQVPLGWLENPVQPEQVRAKFWRNVEHAQHTLGAAGRRLDRSRIQQALAQLEQLESLDDVSPLPALLVAPLSETRR